MKFRTEIDVVPFDRKIDHTMRGLSLGSCFAESVADKLKLFKFTLESNPFGVLYNPLSIAGALDALAARRAWTEEDLECADGLWFSYAHHGAFSSPSAEETLRRMNTAAERGTDALAGADYIIITFGTAWVYELGGRVVANCHKQPQRTFTRRRLPAGEIAARFSELMEGPLKGRQVIFTVSPVRYLKDGFAENSLSKATLRVAVGELIAKYPAAQYFPAYEIVNDDLRDYRFYADDLVHPSTAAIDYVWEKFSAAAFSDSAKRLLPRIENVVRSAAHKPFNRDTEAYRHFRETALRQARELQDAHPEIDLAREMEILGANL